MPQRLVIFACGRYRFGTTEGELAQDTSEPSDKAKRVALFLHSARAGALLRAILFVQFRSSPPVRTTLGKIDLVPCRRLGLREYLAAGVRYWPNSRHLSSR